MPAILIFLGTLIAIVVVAVGVNKKRGVRALYLDAWEPGPGERRLLEDAAADFYVVARLGQAQKMSFARLHRSHVVLTTTRIAIATRALGSRRYMVTHMVHLDGEGDAPAELGKLSGGLFTTGYDVLAARASDMTVENDGDKKYLRIVPTQTASGTMIEDCRLYCDDASGFRDAVAAV